MSHGPTVPCLPLLLQLSHSHFFSSALEDMVLIMADFIALLVKSASWTCVKVSFMGLKCNGALNSPRIPPVLCFCCSCLCNISTFYFSGDYVCLKSFGGWREYSAVNHTCCSCRGPKLDSQSPYGESRGQMLSSGLCRHQEPCLGCTCTQASLSLLKCWDLICITMLVSFLPFSWFGELAHRIVGCD